MVTSRLLVLGHETCCAAPFASRGHLTDSQGMDTIALSVLSAAANKMVVYMMVAPPRIIPCLPRCSAG